MLAAEELLVIQQKTRQVFEILEKAWGKQRVVLVDLKIEFGKDAQGNIIVADVIDNDSWRIWPDGDKSKMLDKQRYRDGKDLASIRDDYERVAEMTKFFLSIEKNFLEESSD